MFFLLLLLLLFFSLPFAFRLQFTLYLRFVFISVTWFSKYNYTVDTRKFVSVSLQRCMFFVCRSSFVRFSFLCKQQSFGGYFQFSVRFARGFVSVYTSLRLFSIIIFCWPCSQRIIQNSLMWMFMVSWSVFACLRWSLFIFGQKTSWNVINFC